MTKKKNKNRLDTTPKIMNERGTSKPSLEKLKTL